MAFLYQLHRVSKTVLLEEMERHGSVGSVFGRNGVDLGEILGRNFHFDSIGNYSQTVGRLGDHRSALANVPVDENGGGGGVVFLSELDNGGVLVQIDDSLTRSQGRIGRDLDALLEVGFNLVLLGQQRVVFKLVDSRNDRSVFQKPLQVDGRDVGHANGLDSASLLLGLQLLVEGDPIIALGDVDFAIFSLGQEGVVVVGVAIESNGPVDQKKVDVVGLEESKRLVDTLGNSVVVGGPHLGGDPEIGPGDDTIGNGPLNRIANGLFGSVDEGSVNVSVASLDGVVHNLLAGVILEGAETQSRHGPAVVEGDCGGSERHGNGFESEGEMKTIARLAPAPEAI